MKRGAPSPSVILGSRARSASRSRGPSVRLVEDTLDNLPSAFALRPQDGFMAHPCFAWTAIASAAPGCEDQRTRPTHHFPTRSTAKCYCALRPRMRCNSIIAFSTSCNVPKIDVPPTPAWAHRRTSPRCCARAGGDGRWLATCF